MTSTENSRHGPGRFFLAVATWTVSISVFWAVVITATTATTWPVADFIEVLALTVGFSAFAGGLATPMIESRSGPRLWVTVGAALMLGTLVYGMLAYVVPWIDFWIGTVAGAESRLTNGAMTPAELKALRANLLESPGSIVETRASASDPFLWAPNWIDYKLAYPLAAGLLTLVNAALGVLCATLTIDLRPGVRRRLRWGAGLASALAFLTLQDAAVSVVAANPNAPALLWTGVSLTPHLVALLLLGLAVRITNLDRRSPIQGGGS